jgi:uncharacterized membrane protein
MEQQPEAEDALRRQLAALLAELQRHRRPQTVGGLTDTVFGLSITLLATAIDVNAGPGKMVTQLLAFAYCFFTLAYIWLRRYQLVRRMTAETEGFVRLNFALLFLVISYTFVLRLFALPAPTAHNNAGLNPGAVLLFAVVTALVQAVLGALYQYALAKDLVQKDDLPRLERTRTAAFVSSAAFALTAPVALVSTQATLYCWLAIWALRVGAIQVERGRHWRATHAHVARQVEG